jgi:iron complex outermembrane receptor protein
MMKKISAISSAFLIFLLFWAPFSGAQSSNGQELLDMNLSQLMSLTVSSVSKKDETIADAPGAIYVITQEEIRRSGVTSIPEALRLAPGVQVNRMDANKWAITIRGFNGRFANKLLVLMDGRAVYTPLFAGVYWEVQDYPLEDIDRIEVIRGGAGTLWGANAVNGVINIITKEVRETQGFLLSAGTGSEEQGFGTLRYGSQTGQNLFYRFYGKAFTRDSFARPHDGQGDDDWNMARTGFKLDWLTDDNESISVHGDYYRGKTGQQVSVADFFSPGYTKSLTEDVELHGGNIFLRWQKKFDRNADFDCHLYYDYVRHQEYVFEERRNTVDFDFQHRFSPLARHTLLWGIGYRFTKDYMKQPTPVTVTHKRQGDDLFSGFFQDEISFFDHRLRVIAGARLEHNDYTGHEIQPNIRSLYTTDDGQTFWAAWSRGIRTPSRLEHTVRFNQQVLPPGYLFPGSPASMAVMKGTSDYKSEEIESWECGFRSQVNKKLFIDLSLFYNCYDKMLSFTYSQPKPPLFNLPATLGNDVDGHSYGTELACTINILPTWRLITTYTFMTMNMDAHQSDSPVKKFFEDDVPRHQFSLRSWLNLPGNLELDSWLRYTDDMNDYDLDNYFSLDVRIGWQVSDTVNISLAGQNLLDDRHLEYGPSTLLNTEVTEIERGFYLKMLWEF